MTAQFWNLFLWLTMAVKGLINVLFRLHVLRFPFTYTTYSILNLVAIVTNIKAHKDKRIKPETIRKYTWNKRNVTTVKITFLSVSAGKESACNTGDLGLITGLGRSPGEGNNYPLQYSGLENFMDSTVHRVAELDTPERLSFSLSPPDIALVFFP